MPLIVSLDEVKQHLDKTTSKDDAELRAFIDSVTPVVEDYVGVVLPRAITERHRAGSRLLLRKGPVLSVTSINDWATDAVAYSPSSVKLDPESGIVYLTSGDSFQGGPYQVTYQAGRLFVDGNIRMGAAMIVAHNWQTQRGKLVRFPGGSDDMQLPPGFTYSVPRKALEYFASERRNKVVVA